MTPDVPFNPVASGQPNHMISGVFTDVQLHRSAGSEMEYCSDVPFFFFSI